MANPAPAVNPIEGNPAPAGPGPAPIPRRQQRFRTAAQPGAQLPVATPAFPVSTALPPLLAHADGYNAVEVPRSGLNTVMPSYLNICLRVFYTNQKLATNDKFLKEVSLYHPDAMDLYCGFIFVYHALRVRHEVGQLSAEESTLLSDLNTEYPLSSLPVPGTIVDALETMTSTENPYSWLGNITTTMPDNADFQDPRVGNLLANNKHMIWPNFKFLIAQLIGTAANARSQTGDWVNFEGKRFASPVLAAGVLARPEYLHDTSPQRVWLTTPHGRVPSLLNQRVALAFQDAVNGSRNAPFFSNFVLDLPSLAQVTSVIPDTLTSYIGIVDDFGLATRNTRYRRWPSQLAAMAATACKYISGSRFLAGIPTTGLGALHHVSKYTSSAVFEVRDPNSDPNWSTDHILNRSAYEAYLLRTLDAALNVRDPVASDLSIQYQMLGQTNVNFDDATDAEGNPLGAAFVMLRSGPFWEYPVAERGPESAVANILMSHLPNFVRSNPRRDAAD